MPSPPTKLFTTPAAHPYLSGDALVCADNMDVLRDLPDECIDLIYLDPPFNSNSNYAAVFGDKGRVAAQLKDIWRWTVETEENYQRLSHGKLLDAINGIRLIAGANSRMAAYAVFMGRRLVEMHRILKPTGSIYLHCDPTANWLLRILLNTVFGSDNFKNEIVWSYRRYTAKSSRFQREHDSVLFYAKKEHTFNVVYDPYGEASGKRDSHYKQDKNGKWFRWQTHKGAKRYKVYLSEGRRTGDVWQISHINSTAKERIGFPTQKPLALLERIIEASSNEGDLVLDPFCGCGTAADAAAKLGRRYLGVDVSAIAVRVMEQRLASRGGKATPTVHNMIWDDYEWDYFERRALMKRDEAEDGIAGWAWAEDKVAGLLNAVPNEKKVGDGGVDARYFTERDEVIPIQVKMHKGQIGRENMDRLLGVQNSLKNQKARAPMSLMVTLYPPRDSLRLFARKQGKVTLRGKQYPRMQILSVQEMLTKGERPMLPPADPRSLVGDTQTRFSISH